MATETKLVPVGLTDYNPNFLHEIVENFLYDHWSDTDQVPRNQIKFNYKIGQNVSVTAKNALKCEYRGQVGETTAIYTHDSAFIEDHIVWVYLASRSINNFADDVPIELHHMVNKIRSIINYNREGLRPYAVMMTFLNAEAIEQDEAAPYIFKQRINIKLKQIFEYITV